MSGLAGDGAAVLNILGSSGGACEGDACALPSSGPDEVGLAPDQVHAETLTS
ncbi:hypothetical protein IT882_07290 [Microbacterium schleiferi]|uniref:Uncharacterized protein n=1 Tax=Microbacterium schleiferi TaxID=69362 RepID=A0A7S8N035_9MICO|nr:hypothetical protein [Microbacterium schleiferi]QPE05770.1 hypothetical protein IT882_07290 [Microbacterium schleiferi]